MFHLTWVGRRRRAALFVTVLVGALFAVCITLTASGEYRLVDAVKDQNRHAVATLISAHADVNLALPDGSTALAWAAYLNDTETADLLLNAGAKVSTADQYGETPLTLACASGNANLTGKFLQGGADANAARWDGETALMIAAWSGNANVVRMLVEHGAKVDAVEQRKGQNALMWAASEGHSGAVEVLLKAGAKPNTASTGGFTPLIFATQAGDAKSVAALLASGADVKYALGGGMNALQIAVATRKSEVATVLIANGAPITEKDRTGSTLLHTAAQQGDVAVVKALLAKGADVNLKTSAPQAPVGGRGGGGGGRGGRGGAPVGEQTPLMLAAQNNHPDVMRLLAAAGADPKAKASDGSTLLMAAARSGHLGAVEYAYELDPDLKAVTDSKQTVMHAAVTGTLANSTPPEICKIVQFLADKGAEVDPSDTVGRTPVAIVRTLPAAAPVAELLTKLIASRK